MITPRYHLHFNKRIFVIIAYKSNVYPFKSCIYGSFVEIFAAVLPVFIQ